MQWMRENHMPETSSYDFFFSKRGLGLSYPDRVRKKNMCKGVNEYV